MFFLCFFIFLGLSKILKIIGNYIVSNFSKNILRNHFSNKILKTIRRTCNCNMQKKIGRAFGALVSAICNSNMLFFWRAFGALVLQLCCIAQILCMNIFFYFLHLFLDLSKITKNQRKLHSFHFFQKYYKNTFCQRNT